MPKLFIRVGLIALLIAIQPGCGASVEQVPNTSRAATKWTRKDAPERVCLEYSTAVAETGKNKLGFEVPATLPSGTTLAPKLTVERETNIAQIYTVSETLQLGHAALYRLCEARGNGDIKDDAYPQMFSKVFDQVKELIQVQVDVRHHKIVLERVRVADELEVLDRDIRQLRIDYDDQMKAAQCAAQVPGPELQTRLKQIPPYPDQQSVSLLQDVSATLSGIDAAKFTKDAKDQEAKKAECIANVDKAKATLVKLVAKEAERTTKDSKLRGIDSALRYLFLDSQPKPETPPAAAPATSRGNVAKPSDTSGGPPK